MNRSAPGFMVFFRIFALAENYTICYIFKPVGGVAQLVRAVES